MIFFLAHKQYSDCLFLVYPFFHHRLVIETLEGVEKDRKCYRMVGGVLVERKVADVEPALVSNKEKVCPI